jgi:hypothetical protein
MKQVCGGVARENVDANFLFQVFGLFKMYLRAFLNKGVYASMRQNITPRMYILSPSYETYLRFFSFKYI